jgi:hypothetical protein
MEAYPRAVMERAMKVQDVTLQAMAKKITWWQAAEILGISDRHMRRIRERYVEEGYNGLVDRRRGKPSRGRVPMVTVEKVFALYREGHEGLVAAMIDLNEISRGKFDLDVAGHYAGPDVFSLTVDVAPKCAVFVENAAERSASTLTPLAQTTRVRS